MVNHKIAFAMHDMAICSRAVVTSRNVIKDSTQAITELREIKAQV